MIEDNENNYLDVIISGSAETIPEEVFKRQYLPLLFHEDPSMFNMRWLNEVAKSPHARVYVVDGRGTPIHSVPPLCDSPISGLDINVINALNYIQMERNIHPIKGVKLMDANLPTLIKVNTKGTSEHEEEWREILLRYGYGGDQLVKKDDDIDQSGISLSGDCEDW